MASRNPQGGSQALSTKRVKTTKSKKVRTRRTKNAVSFLPALSRNRFSNFPRFGFPLMLTTKLKYVENITLSSTNGTLGTYVFRANGLFDPNLTVTGTQPMYFDQLMAIYDHFTVTSSVIKVIAGPQAGTAQTGGFFGLLVDDDATVPTSLKQFQEQSTSVLKYIPDTWNETLTLSKRWNAADYFTGNPASVLADVDLQGTSAADPNEQSYFVLGYQSLAGAPLSSITCICEIEFTATFAELKTMITS